MLIDCGKECYFGDLYVDPYSVIIRRSWNILYRVKPYMRLVVVVVVFPSSHKSNEQHDEWQSFLWHDKLKRQHVNSDMYSDLWAHVSLVYAEITVLEIRFNKSGVKAFQYRKLITFY